MTYEKAIDYVLGGAILRNPSKDRELRTMIIEALEKQVPKKVIKYKRIGDVLIGGYCPACGAELHISNRPCYCGQVLNWSDEE